LAGGQIRVFPRRGNKGSGIFDPLGSGKACPGCITVTDIVSNIEISSEKKDEPITIGDILFASRALCIGPDRSVDQYQVLSDDGITLILFADIDNWST
jgi:hypothetical protein